jgi:hypothetical protein
MSPEKRQKAKVKRQKSKGETMTETLLPFDF